MDEGSEQGLACTRPFLSPSLKTLQDKPEGCPGNIFRATLSAAVLSHQPGPAQPSCSEAASSTAPLSHPITLRASQRPSQLHPAAPQAPSSAFSSPLPPGENATSCPPRGWTRGTRPVPFVGCPVPRLHPERGAQRKPLALDFLLRGAKFISEHPKASPVAGTLGARPKSGNGTGTPRGAVSPEQGPGHSHTAPK